MGQRKERRVTPDLSVRASGIDAAGQAFSQLARVRDISRSGARLQRVRSPLLVGGSITLQYREMKAEFRVVRVVTDPSDKQGEVGLQILPSQPDLWGVYISDLVATSENG
jgi:hypothetical protein